MIDVKAVSDGVVNYANSHVIPILPASKQFLAGFAVGVLREKAETMTRNLGNNAILRMSGVVDGQQVDIDALYHAAKEQMQRGGALEIDVPFIGKLTFREGDVDDLYNTIIRG